MEHLILEQHPSPGSFVLTHRGDTLKFTLTVSGTAPGTAFLRTSVGKAPEWRDELVRHVETDTPILSRDWRDIPMASTDGTHYSLTLPMLEVSRYEAKAFFLPAGSDDPIWPDGKNVAVKVEPAEYCCSNSIYSAFVRQFGPNKRATARSYDEQIAILEKDDYSVIPRSGTFRDLIGELDFIMGTLGHRIIQLLPIHPTPTTHARMGRFGSPFAALDFMDVDPALSEFDRRTTPLEQFVELADAVHCRCGKLFIDIPINHTGWASHLQIERPDWFVRHEDSTFQSPGAWGVTWEDLAKLSYDHKDLWTHMAKVFLFWCSHGVDGFRCDAGYMVPVEVWQYITAKVRQQYPDTIFMLEGLGGSVDVTNELLTKANLNWAYSELFQNYDRHQVESYLPNAVDISSTRGLLVNFSETHDNNRLAATSYTYSRLRTALAAFCSHSGAFGIANGVEWYAREKIDVHGAASLNWGRGWNQAAHIRRINAVLTAHPCFHCGAALQMIQAGKSNTVVVKRVSSDTKYTVLVAANLNHKHPAIASWPSGSEHSIKHMVDLLTGSPVELDMEHGLMKCHLKAGQVMCLAEDGTFLKDIKTAETTFRSMPKRIREQCLAAKALEVYTCYRPASDIEAFDAEHEVPAFSADPQAYCQRMSGRELAPVTRWIWPRDTKRTVMLPPGNFLYVQSPYPFRAGIKAQGKTICHEHSIAGDNGFHFVLVRPLDEPPCCSTCSLEMTVHNPAGAERADAVLLRLTSGRDAAAKMSFGRSDIIKNSLYALQTNGRGAMSQVRGLWGDIRTQYDAFLAANLHSEYPVDRTVLFTRCRAWIACEGYTREIDKDCILSMRTDRHEGVIWHFAVPTGQGRIAAISISLKMIEDRNAIAITFTRQHSQNGNPELHDNIPLKLVIRPDLEHRTNHEKTKAFSGPEKKWPAAVEPHAGGFTFDPLPKHALRIDASRGTFSVEPEWTYMVTHPYDEDRGMDGCSDLFSPGYFTALLEGKESVTLTAQVAAPGEDIPAVAVPTPSEMPAEPVRVPIAEAMLHSMTQFIVKRDELKTVIAGYPWFLDWGRDTLICLRGMIAANMLEDSAKILKQFARLEKHGTLPNMICGGNDSNRDTSDAPLWLFVACSDLTKAEDSLSFFEERCGDRSINEVLNSILHSYIGGTDNGIAMDPDSGLIFSPKHFTWMDTNHPAGTPREGYPIEIQALWHFALRFTGESCGCSDWIKLADRVRESILDRYIVRPRDASSGIYLSDCLHAAHGRSADQAKPDDHLRCNQLFAVTLGAVTDKDICSAIIDSCEELLVPGAIRSLADREVQFKLPVTYRGKPVNDPSRPYCGNYRGDENTQRKPAYHNGTAWTWPFPSYSEALHMTFGEPAMAKALSILSSSSVLTDIGCIGHIPEIIDGNTPHTPRGCGAQAWGATELYRVLAILTETG